MALLSHLLSRDLSWNHRKQIWQHPHVLPTLMYILSHAVSLLHSIFQTTTTTTSTTTTTTTTTTTANSISSENKRLREIRVSM